MRSNRNTQHVASTGLDILDKQHRNLVKLITDAVECLEIEIRNEGTAENRERYHHLLNDMFEASLEHFRCEEELLRVAGYPLIDAHREEHNDFIERITELFSGTTNLDAVCDYLKTWLERHKAQSDADYVKHLEGLGEAGVM